MSLLQAPSPRTDAAPMAFTAGEFVRGALYAWGLFLGLSTLAFVPLFLSMFWLPLYVTLPWSLGALLIGAPIAYVLGRMLLRVHSLVVHVVAFTTFGAAVGVATTALAMAAEWTGLSQPSFTGYAVPMIVVCAAATAAVPLGWWLTASRALRRDESGPPARTFRPEEQ